MSAEQGGASQGDKRHTGTKADVRTPSKHGATAVAQLLHQGRARSRTWFERVAACDSGDLVGKSRSRVGVTQHHTSIDQQLRRVLHACADRGRWQAGSLDRAACARAAICGDGS